MALKKRGASGKNAAATPETPKTITTAEIEEQEKSCGAAKATGMVFVALNRPTGIRYTLKNGRHVDIGGNAAHLRGREYGVLPVKGGFGLTPVAKSDWEEIKATYGQTALFKSGRIFAHESREDTLAHTREMKDSVSGLEPTRGRQTQPQEK